MKIKFKFIDILKLYFSDYLSLVGGQTLFWAVGDLFDIKDYIEIKDIRDLVIATTLCLFSLSVLYFVLCNFTPLRDKSSPEILYNGAFPCLTSIFGFYVLSKLFLIELCNEFAWDYKAANAIVIFVYAIISGLIYSAVTVYIKNYRLKKINEKLNQMNHD